MNWDQIAGQFKQYSGRLREKFGELSDNDIQATQGRRDQIEGLIQQRYGITKEEAHKRLEDFLNTVERTRTSGSF